MIKIILLASLSSLLLGCAGQVNEQDTSNNSDNTTINSEQNNQNEEKEIESYRNIVQNFTSISAKDIINKINNGDAFYLFVGKETCLYYLLLDFITLLVYLYFNIELKRSQKAL